MIEIYKASAGSGKTFTLAKKFIGLLLNSQDPFNYKHVLAVTFTNKATAEMKERILKELFRLSQNPSESPYYSDFKDIPNLQNKSKKILINILHDYSAFSVSTIDSFFQRTLRAFAKELGQFPSYQVELNRGALIEESVGNLLDSLDEKSGAEDLLNWLIESATRKIKEGKKLNVSETLNSAAKNVLGKEFIEKAKENDINVNVFYDKANLKKIGKFCDDYIDKYSAALTAVCNDLDKALIDYRNYVYAPYRNVIQKYSSKPQKGYERYDAFINKARVFIESGDDGAIFRKGTKEDIRNSAISVLEKPIRILYYLLQEPYDVYQSLELINKEIYNLGIVKEITDEFNNLIREKNVIGIDETDYIINGLISDTDAPFIYEKLGVRYNNFLLDEFQDTSIIQWKNFFPLLEESDANDNASLIVGDVKQSIYRFRGGDWKLLGSGVTKKFPSSSICKLDTNWRSYKNIIDFNNDVFAFIVKKLDEQFGDLLTESKLSEIYSDVVQKVSETKQDLEDKGSVEIDFVDKGNVPAYVIKAIDEIIKKKGKYGEIAILVRDNASASIIANELAKNNIPLISDDSLKVKSSQLVNKLVAFLYYLDYKMGEEVGEADENQPKHKKQLVTNYLAESMKLTLPDNYNSLIDLCEILLRNIKDNNNELFNSQLAYILAFMDEVKAWVQNNGNNIMQFLSYWENVDPSLNSAKVSNAVTITTVHKSKGLEYPYVILPYPEKIDLYKNDKRWCKPKFVTENPNNEIDSSLLEDNAQDFKKLSKGLFPINLGKDTEFSAFREDYANERYLQLVDNLNIFYVALTRATKRLHIISETPSKSFRDQKSDISDFSHLLWDYLNNGINKEYKPKDSANEPAKDAQEEKDNCIADSNKLLFVVEELTDKNQSDAQDAKAEGADKGSDEVKETRYEYGEFKEFDEKKAKKKKKDPFEEIIIPIELNDYPTFDLNHLDKEGKMNNRLIFSSDAVDFFGEDGKVGMEASNRIRGTILHNILSNVASPSDLDRAVRKVELLGLIDEDEAKKAKEILIDAIECVKDLGWFPENGEGVSTEVPIFDKEGNVYRPDRLVEYGNRGVMVIDYKFGEEESKYKKQVKRYAFLLKELGYEEVKAYLWYIDENGGKIVSVSQ